MFLTVALKMLWMICIKAAKLCHRRGSMWAERSTQMHLQQDLMEAKKRQGNLFCVGKNQ